MGNRIHTIDFFSICAFVGEQILSFDSNCLADGCLVKIKLRWFCIWIPHNLVDEGE
jgi:hypothetical protein